MNPLANLCKTFVDDITYTQNKRFILVVEKSKKKYKFEVKKETKTLHDLVQQILNKGLNGAVFSMFRL